MGNSEQGGQLARAEHEVGSGLGEQIVKTVLLGGEAKAHGSLRSRKGGWPWTMLRARAHQSATRLLGRRPVGTPSQAFCRFQARWGVPWVPCVSSVPPGAA